MLDSQKIPFLGADANDSRTQPINASGMTWNPDEVTRFDSSPEDSVQGTSAMTPLFERAMSDWKSTMKNNYTASLADGDPLDGVAEAKLVQMRATPSVTESKGAGVGNADVATDAGEASGQKWNRDAAIQHLNDSAQPASKGKCATYVRQAIEAGGIRLDRSLNPTQKGSAYGYGPVFEGAGFKSVPEGTPSQAGDAVIFSNSPDYEHGHAAMYNGTQWVSDFKQDIMYASKKSGKTENILCDLSQSLNIF